jgi:hypothetical protein
MKKIIKAWASVRDNGDIKVFATAFSPYTIFPSKEQAECLEIAFPTGGKVVPIEIHILAPKKKIG